MPVVVPNVVGTSNPVTALAAVGLRHLGHKTFDANGDGSATEQDPPAGAVVPRFTVVEVSYPSPLGPLPDTNIEGPTLPAGTYDAFITRVSVGNPFGSGQGAWLTFVIEIDGGQVDFDGTLYFDHALHPGTPPPNQIEWMRRGAALGMAQRAFTNNHRVRLVTTQDVFIQSIDIVKS